jgi:hypothetical protein
VPPLRLQVDGEELPPEIEVWFDPQVTFTKHDEGREVLNPIGIQVLQLNLIVVEEPEEEAAGRSRVPALMEVHEWHHIAIGR